MISYAIYVVDDEETIREGVTMALETDYQVKAFSSAEAAIEAMNNNPPDLVLLDIGLPGMDGIEALGRIIELYPDILTIMITAYEDINTVISAMKLGAHDYVVKPIHMDALEVTIRNALETVRLRKEVQLLQEKYLKENLPCFIGESNAIQDVMAFVGMVAKSPDTPILILGETGTGKELIASAIHYRSPNFKGPLVTVNCGAIPNDLIESELFGYERGAFSGASASGKKGLVEQAANGTLFLDEVGDLSMAAQAKLLRFLEDGEYYRLGGAKKLRIQTRVVSATNKDLESMIEKGDFRRDLYYRLAVIKVEVPSLNNRRDDIVPIARHFLVEFGRKHGKTFSGLSPQAEDALKKFHWEGNVRELRNVIERGVLVGKGPELTLQDLGIEYLKGETHSEQSLQGVGPSKPGAEIAFPPIPPTGIDFSSVQESLERYYIAEALRLAGGNESKAAQLLNINHHTFRYRRKKLQIK
ncbi:MAG: sigma-54-dependent Fis family transcriptional regulator [Deltaproteobacteria bacterium]|nr:sigma-54-dependent Fis family transcriptional regulator [Deltaproteobacteria bacterium]MBW2018980.1 sigma-54-dependent Fis family transcriptional regulator [Deltaproteobacteria bacterium]MBW2073570.1 sigma-54-dependent Fis family transcriptional regulator [Deltaproteobacteria bacterium]